MVSFDHTPLSPTPGGEIIHQELEGFSKKRKLNKYESEYEEFSEKSVRVLHHQNAMMMNCITSSTDLHLETPLPSEWQRCLDIKSGKLYFYNTRTQKRASSDPRSSPEPPPLPSSSSSAPAHMSLDLELNLPCGSSMAKNYQVTENFTKLLNSGSNTTALAEDDHHHHHQFMNSSALKNTTTNNNTSIGSALSRSPSWLTFEGEQEEMVTAVCKKCHMLVMMCKSSPACPNCKFMHSPDQSTPTLFKSRSLSLLC